MRKHKFKQTGKAETTLTTNPTPSTAPYKWQRTPNSHLFPEEEGV